MSIPSRPQHHVRQAQTVPPAPRMLAAADQPTTSDSGIGWQRVDVGEARDFLRQYFAENPNVGGSYDQRWRQVHNQVSATGTYQHTAAELTYGAKLAWRNASRCIGRLYWRSLRVRDAREASTPAEVFRETVAHLRQATNGGRLRPTLTVFAPADPHGCGVRIYNEQLIRYAGWRQYDDSIVGDPRNAGFTALCRRLGWRGGTGGAFDVLPVVIRTGVDAPQLFDLPADAVLEVPLSHPDHPWFAELGLRWHAVPAISNMRLQIGGISYHAAPFNGWYMGTEIGARNLADTDRYNLIPEIAKQLNLDTSSNATLWRDRALVELNIAVLHSFARDGVTITDHHTESDRFITHIAKELRAGRSTPADWSWIVPPMSGSLTSVFHHLYDQADLSPSFHLDTEARLLATGQLPPTEHVDPATNRCPYPHGQAS